MEAKFTKATRNAYRYKTTSGNVTTEDLWNMPLCSNKGRDLDSLALAIEKELSCTSTKSFVYKNKEIDDTLETKFEIVKHVIKTRIKEVEQKRDSIRLLRNNARIKELIGEKKAEELKGKSIEELEAMIKN